MEDNFFADLAVGDAVFIDHGLKNKKIKMAGC